MGGAALPAVAAKQFAGARTFSGRSRLTRPYGRTTAGVNFPLDPNRCSDYVRYRSARWSAGS
jgi:hypothetical protein